MQRRTVIAAVATSVAVGVGIAVLTQRVSGAFDQMDAAAGLKVANTTAIATPTATLTASGSAVPALVSLDPATATASTSPSPVDAFTATRADLERRFVAGANLPNGAALSSADIAGLLAGDPQFQSALMDLARDADPEVRREAAQFLAGIEGGGETSATE